MASIRKKATSPFWFACYYKEDGTRAQTSTKTEDKKEAQRIADDLEQAHVKKATEGQMRRILSGLSERLTGAPLASATLRDYTTQWLLRKKAEVAAISYAAYKSAVDDFVERTPAKADMQLQYVTTGDVAAYRDYCAGRTTAKTANNKLKIVRTLLQSAWRDGLIQENPAAKVPVLKAEDSIRRPFTMDELARLLDKASDEWKGMILVGLYTGQRLKDVATLTWTNVNLVEKQIELTQSKTKRRQIIPLAKPLLAYFMKCEAGDDPRAPLFPAAWKLVKKDGDVGRVSQDFYDLLVLANLATERPAKDEPSGKGRRGRRERNPLTFHCLRHTATSLLKNAGVSEAVAMDLVGHDSKAVSQNYTHLDESTKREAMDKLPDVTAYVPRKDAK
jgi:integrase